MGKAMQSQWVGHRLRSPGHTSNGMGIALWTMTASVEELEAMNASPRSHLPSDNPSPPLAQWIIL